MDPPLRFYGGDTLFTNFAPTPVTIDGNVYPTTEHYFQAMKFATTAPDYAKEIQNASSPTKAKSLGNSRKYPIEDNWNDKRDDVMRVALFSKAIQHSNFLQALLKTGRRELIEAAPRDYYWGEGAKKTGKNMLGKLLMELRTKLQNNRPTMYYG